MLCTEDEVSHERTSGGRMLRWPVTREGRRAGWLVAIAAGLTVGGMLMAGIWFGLAEEPGGDQESPPVWLQVPMVASVLAGGIAAVSSGVLAILALRQGDRSLVLVPAILAMLAAVTFVAGEFAVPH